MAQKRAHSQSLSTIPEIFHSTKIDEQTSSFIGAFSPSLSAAALQRLPEFRTATHRIAAWRKPSRQKSLTPSKPLFEIGHDDDGESWAGGRIARVLNDTQVAGTVVVARWYGGQNIGPIRFTHIENCAKEAIWKWKVAVSDVEREEASKKQRVDDEARRKELVEELAQRDHSISALRNLLAEKKAKLSGEEVAPATPQKAIDYGKMGLDVLKRLDKARDATIGAILKQMDKLDEDLKLLDGLDDDALDELDETEPPAERQTQGLDASNDEATTTQATKAGLDQLEEEPKRLHKQDDDHLVAESNMTSTG
ncbi:RWD repeat domain-containing protein [Stagonosporopsis vannaccii]|nr:RWD repeat domain-containing protein [Stagonosporopsis vannaccii]